MKNIDRDDTPAEPLNEANRVQGLKADVRAASILDNEVSRLKELIDIHLSNLEFLKEFSQRYPILTSPNSGINQLSSEYGIPEIDKFEKSNREDFQTAVGQSLVRLEYTIIALEEKGFELADERTKLALYKTAYKWADYNYNSSVPEYGSLSKRGGIAKTIFGMNEIGLETSYDDRLMSWDYDKYESARAKAGIRRFPKTFKQIQGFLSNYYGRPVELRWVQSIDPGNGHNLLLYGFRFIDKKTK